MPVHLYTGMLYPLIKNITRSTLFLHFFFNVFFEQMMYSIANSGCVSKDMMVRPNLYAYFIIAYVLFEGT